MSEELKTLKDIDGTCDELGYYADRKELKAEAVKWVKFGGCEHQIKWIKQFFNLTEEDLEENKDE